MVVFGLDTAAAPSAHKALQMLQSFGGDFWSVYIGGPRNGGSGWTPNRVAQYVAAGIGAFLPIYVGQQEGDPLNAGQGAADGHQAVQLMQHFGWGNGAPCALDVERGTSDSDPSGAVAYADGWCKVVRDAGYVPGVYGGVPFLADLAHQTNRPSFAFPANWIRHGFDPAIDPDHIPGLPASAYPGMRVWQYAGGPGAQVMGLDVDFDAANFPMAPPPNGATPGRPANAPVITPVRGQDYTVQAGDNLSAIAASHGVSLAALEAANPQIPDFNVIHPGDVIHIPH
jgi:hypothetical protein